jgi:hypothetical protein
MPMTLSVTNFDSGQHRGMCSFCGVDQLAYDVTVSRFDSITSSKKQLCLQLHEEMVGLRLQ